MEGLRRELERFLPPGMARYALEEAPRIDELLGELERLERRHHTLTLAWPRRGLVGADAGGYELPGCVLAGVPAVAEELRGHPAHARLAEVLLAALEEYNGRLLAWGAGVFLVFFPGVTASGSATQANLFRACQTASELAELEDLALAQAVVAGRVAFHVLEALERRVTLPVGGAVEESLTAAAAARPGEVRLGIEVARVVAERFAVDEGEGGPRLGTLLSGRRVNKAVIDDPAPVPPEALLERLAQAARGMERARPWLAPWQLDPLGARHTGVVPLSFNSILALAWPPPGEAARLGRRALTERLRLESELCANWGGELWGLISHPRGPFSVYAFADAPAAAEAGFAVLGETGDRGGAVELGRLEDLYLRGASSSVVVPAGIALERAGALARSADPGELVCREETAAGLEPEFEVARRREVNGFELRGLAPSAAREEAGLPLLGCGEMLARADDWITRLKAGRGVIGMITAPPGGGKSRACAELRDLFAEIGDAFLFHCQPWWAYDPYSLWRRTLPALWGPPSSTGAARAQREALGEAAERLRPFIARFTAGELSEPLWGLPPALKGQMAAELLLAALRARGDRPLTLIVDDADWLDAGSLALIRTLVSSGPPIAVLLCGRRKPAGPEADEVRLAPLSPDEAADLYADLTAGPADALASLKPAELLPARLVLLAMLVRAGREPRMLLRLPLERLAAELFAAEDQAEAVSRVSVLGPRFGAADLAAVTDDVVALRGRLEGAALLERGGGEYAFRGLAAWRAAYGALDPARRRELHFNAARFYQRQHRGVTALAVAHFMNCGDPVERITALELAGERAAAVGSFTAAADYLRRAAEQAGNRRDARRLRTRLAAILAERPAQRREAEALLQQLWEELEEGEDDQREALALERAELHRRIGEPDKIERWLREAGGDEAEPRRLILRAEAALLREETAEARDCLARAAEAEGATAIRATVKLGRLLLERGETAEAAKPLRRAAAWAAENENIALAVEAARALAELHTARGDSERALSALEDALERERALLQTGPLARTLTELARYRRERGGLVEAERHLAEACRLFRRLDDPLGVLEAESRWAEVLAELGRLDEARRLYAGIAAGRAGIRDRIGGAGTALERGRLAALQGDWREANREYDLALVGARELSLDDLTARARRGYARALYIQGRPGEAAELDLGPAESTILRAEVCRELYLFNEARELHVEAFGAEPAEASRRLELALDHLAAGELRRGRALLGGLSWPAEPPLETALKLRRARSLTAFLARRGDAVEEAEAYRELALKAGVVVDAALADKQAAAVRVLGGDVAAARGLIDEALDREPPPLFSWQLLFLDGLLAGRDGDAAGKRHRFAAALELLNGFAAGLDDGLRRLLTRGEAYNTLRRGA